MAVKTGNELMAEGLGWTKVMSRMSCANAARPSRPVAGTAESNEAVNVLLVIMLVLLPFVSSLVCTAFGQRGFIRSAQCC